MRWTIISILVLCCSSEAATKYVATDGSNAATGGFADPWLTIRYGVSTMAANDTLLIRGGTYPSDGFVIESVTKGTGTNYSIVKNYPGETVIYHPTVADIGWNFKDVTNVWLEGFSIDATDSLYAACKLTTSGGETGGNIVLTNMNFWGCPRGHGVLTSGIDKRKSVLITHCNFYTNGWASVTPDNQLHQIYIQDSNVTIENCYIQGTTNSLGGTHGVHFFNSGCTNVTIRNNFITNCPARGILASGAGNTNFQAYNNVISGCGIGIELNTIPNGYVLNNTLYSNSVAITLDSSTNCYVENNIATRNAPDSRGAIGLTSSQQIYVRNNLCYSNIFSVDGRPYFDFRLVSGNGTVTTNGNLFNITQQFTNFGLYNVKFVSPATGNYRLLTGSSAIDAALTQSIFTTDYDGNNRGVLWEIGAFAFTSSASTNSTLTANNARSAP